MRVKVFHWIKPVLRYVPEVSAPDRRQDFRSKVFWTGIALACFLILSQIPLFGIGSAGKNDPFYWLRTILASNRGTLMELGIGPLVTTSMCLQFLTQSRIIEIDNNIQEDRQLFAATQKLAGLVFTAIQASAMVSSGMYGPMQELGSANAAFIVVQLTFSGLIVLLLDELLTKGYGFGSGISLFIATNICETVVWKAMSFVTINTPSGPQYEGAIPAFIYQLVFSSNRMQAITEAFYRPYGTNLTNLIATFMVFLAVTYLQGFKLMLNVKSQRMRGQTGSYPIRLFYTSNMPIILYSALISNVYFFSQLLYKRFKSNMFVNMLGQWQEIDYTGESLPVGGLVYYLSPPSSMLNFLVDPFRSVIYCVLVISACALLSKYWIELSGESPRDVAKKFREQGIVIAGHRDASMLSCLQKYIPPCAQLGGALIGILTILADLVGCIGSGTGILLAVTITYGYFEEFAKEPRMMQALSMFG